MSNNFKDLREKVASMMKETIHGRKFDLQKIEHPRIPHMLGITNIGDIHDASDEDGTILDPSHEFWDKYTEDINTKHQAEVEIEQAVTSLSEHNILRISYPYGRDGDIMYVEVDDISSNESGLSMQVECKECDNHTTIRPNIVLDRGYYYLKFTVDCAQCEFRSTYKTSFVKS